MTTADEAKVLTDDEVQRVWANNKIGELIISPEIDALCATVRALREKYDSLKSKIAWHRDGVGPDVPVLQERYDRLMAQRTALTTGLANIYHVITNEECDRAIALGMATSAVSSLLNQNTALREQLARLQTPRMFPIQRGVSVRWELAEKAYATYSKMFGTDQTLERLAERGGFGREEFACLYLGHDPRCEDRHKCTEKVEAEIGFIARLQSQLAQVTQERDRLQEQLAEEVAKRVNSNVEQMEQSQKITQADLKRHCSDDRLTDTQRGSYQD